MVQASTSADGWFQDEWQATLTRRLRRAVVFSLALHLGVLIVVAVVRIPQQAERPLASIEISLANLPTPPVKAIEPVKSQPKTVEVPVPVPVKPAPMKAAPMKLAPVPTPVAPPSPVAPSRAAPIAAPPTPAKLSNDVMRDVMKGIELPSDAPKFGDFSPADKLKKAQLKLPDVPVASEVREPATKVVDMKPRQSVTDDLSTELDEEFKKLKKPELPKPVPVQVQAKPTPQVEAKVPSVKAVDTTLKMSGMAPGSNAYLGLVKRKISNMWSAPPIADASASPYGVTVKFRIHRDGKVTGVIIEQSSGNDYYDLAGKRAVLSADPLPPFPADITESSYDAHFTFTVGEPQG
jgi:colicin import membrane protein